MSNNINSLRRCYKIQEKSDCYHLYCEVCKRWWSLPQDKVSIGSILKLLDHAYGHEDNDEDEE